MKVSCRKASSVPFCCKATWVLVSARAGPGGTTGPNLLMCPRHAGAGSGENFRDSGDGILPRIEQRRRGPGCQGSRVQQYLVLCSNSLLLYVAKLYLPLDAADGCCVVIAGTVRVAMHDAPHSAPDALYSTVPHLPLLFFCARGLSFTFADEQRSCARAPAVRDVRVHLRPLYHTRTSTSTCTLMCDCAFGIRYVQFKW